MKELLDLGNGWRPGAGLAGLQAQHSLEGERSGTNPGGGGGFAREGW